MAGAVMLARLKQARSLARSQKKGYIRYYINTTDLLGVYLRKRTMQR